MSRSVTAGFKFEMSNVGQWSTLEEVVVVDDALVMLLEMPNQFHGEIRMYS